MNKFLYEMTGVTEEELATWLKEHGYQAKDRLAISDFFQKIQRGEIIRNKETGELIYSPDYLSKSKN